MIFKIIFLFLYTLSFANLDPSYHQFDIKCIVDNWKSLKCTFEPPKNYTDLTLCYSRCYGCMNRDLYYCPNFMNNTCTWNLPRYKKDQDSYQPNNDFTYTIFACHSQNGTSIISSKKDFQQKAIVKPDPVEGLNYSFLSNNSVKITWKITNRNFQFKITLKENGSEDSESQVETTTAETFEYFSLRPKNYFHVYVQRKPIEGGFWSEPAMIGFETGDEDYGHGELVKFLGYKTLNMAGTAITIQIYWKVMRQFITIKTFTINTYSISDLHSILISSTPLPGHSRAFQTTLGLMEGVLFRVAMTTITDNNKSSQSDIVISFEDDFTKLSDVPALISDDKYALLSWHKTTEVQRSNVTIFFDNFNLHVSDIIQIESHDLPQPITMSDSITSYESPSLIGRQLHISFQRLKVIRSEQLLLHGPLIQISCRYYLNGSIAPPSNVTYIKEASFNSLHLIWNSQLECDSRYFTHIIMEYYPTDCESCSKKAKSLKIPRQFSNWSINGMVEGPYQLRMKAVCFFNGQTSESVYSPYITVRVTGQLDSISLVIPISLCSMILLLIAGAVVGSKVRSNLKSKVLIQVPDSTCITYPLSNEKHQYSSLYSSFFHPFQKAKSLYNLMFPSQNVVFSTPDKQDLFAWWNPNYKVYQKHFFGSCFSLPSEKQYFKEMDYNNGNNNLYLSEGVFVRNDIDLYSSVKILS